ncbi:MAG: hypothetical protein IJK66_01935 [Bacilli bacterium]|nr:hypothetical protein [Bacilli bacterium]
MMDSNSALLLSYMLRLGEDEEMTAEDIKNAVNKEVSDCQVALCLNVVKLLGKDTPYDVIFDYIDKYTDEDFDELLEDQKSYIKTRIKRDLNTRKRKLEGEDK